MGGSLCRNAPLRRMVEKTAKDLGIKTFVETGTNQGLTTRWAAFFFESVYTIEADIEKAMAMADNISEKAPQLDHVRSYYGDAGELLPRILEGATGERSKKSFPGIREPAIFWLDAHDKTERPPIRETLAAVLAHRDDHIIYIDDIQYYFLQCFPGWPTLDELRQMLDGRALAAVSDAIIAYPPKHGQFLKKIAKAERRSTLIPGILT